MRNDKPLFLTTCLSLFFLTQAFSQAMPGVMAFYSAQWYDRFEGAARIAQVQKLQDGFWYTRDTIYALGSSPESPVFQTEERFLGPFQDGHRNTVYLVSHVAPKFPGGATALEQYNRDFLGPVICGPNDEVQRSVYIRCTIDTNGAITDVAEAQPHAGIVAEYIIEQCLDAVRNMPEWSPGIFDNQPVHVGRLIVFNLKE